MNQNSSFSVPDFQARIERNAYFITIALIIAGVLVTLLFGYYGFIDNYPILYIPAFVTLLGTFIDSFWSLSLIQKNRLTTAMIVNTVVYMAIAISIITVVQGLALISSITSLVLLFAISSLGLYSKYSTFGIIIGLIFSGLVFLSDAVLSTNRVIVPGIETYLPYIASITIISLILLFFIRFSYLNLQSKITISSIFASAIVLFTTIYFGFDRVSLINNLIRERYESSLTTETENQIQNRIQAEAEQVDKVFSEIIVDTLAIAKYRTNLENQRNVLTNGQYWNSVDKVFQLPDGQYGNSGSDVASIYIPNTVEINEQMLADINTSIYLDFVAPNLLETHPEIIAMYFISNTGYTVYYPNINLAQNVPPDFDPRTDTYFTTSLPEANPEKEPRWTAPYLDPAGNGNVVTLTIPVYADSGEFLGVIGVDVQLNIFNDIISDVQLSKNSFAFLTDSRGVILSMPEVGYQVFGLEPQALDPNVFDRQTVLDTQSQNLKSIAQRILIGDTQLISFSLNGVQTYVAVEVLPSLNYKLVFFAPATDLNAAILSSREEIQTEVDNALQVANLLIVILIIAIIVISLFVGQVITRPIKRLTQTVEQISEGNLTTARANVETQDEIGVLGRTFNTMADTLNQTLTGLEVKVAERTSELEIISRSNAERAAQFESIAKISRIISSTQTLDQLLPQITESISKEFDFYHVGIFLLDAHKDYAVLVAANSEGGLRMLGRNHRLRVGETGIVGFVTRSGQARIALDVGADAVYFNNPDLPETRSELALPLRIEADILGALDVQSTKTNAFTEQDINILSVLADQVSIAIQNARLYQQSQEALEQAQFSAAQMIEQQWGQYLSRQNVTQYHFDGVEARQSVNTEGQMQNLAIPLILRGAQIGKLKLSTADPNRIWNDDEIAIAQAIAERTAIALENARLLQEAQKRAAKEKTIGDISSKITNLIGLENILETTLKELGNTLPNTEVSIQFSKDVSEQ